MTESVPSCYLKKKKKAKDLSFSFCQVGGFDGFNHLKSAEAYNPKTDTWHLVPSMHTARSNFGIEVIDDQVFVVGGFSGLKSIGSAECYDADAQRWFEAEEMQNSRFGLSCCLISGFPSLTREFFACDRQANRS